MQILSRKAHRMFKTVVDKRCRLLLEVTITIITTKSVLTIIIITITIAISNRSFITINRFVNETFNW